MTGGKGKPPLDRASSGPDIAIEVALGARIRASRVAAGMTQRALGEAVGIAYQKLQKYELGQDRIAVSTLQSIAKALRLHPGELFDDPMPKSIGAALDVIVARRSIELVQEVSHPRVVQKMLDLIEELAGDDHQRKIRDPMFATERSVPDVKTERTRRTSMSPARAVVAPLLEMLRQTNTNDAGALAHLFGQALAEAEEILRQAS